MLSKEEFKKLSTDNKLDVLFGLFDEIEIVKEKVTNIDLGFNNHLKKHDKRDTIFYTIIFILGGGLLLSGAVTSIVLFSRLLQLSP